MRPLAAAAGNLEQLPRDAPAAATFASSRTSFCVSRRTRCVARNSVRMHEARGLRELAQRFERMVMKAVHALQLVGNDERLLPQRVLRRNAGRAVARYGTSAPAGSRART